MNQSPTTIRSLVIATLVTAAFLLLAEKVLIILCRIGLKDKSSPEVRSGK